MYRAQLIRISKEEAMSGSTIVFYMKTGGREIRIYVKTGQTRSIRAAVVTDMSSSRCGGISRPLKTPSLMKVS
jgi:hypothetical protein